MFDSLRWTWRVLRDWVAFRVAIAKAPPSLRPQVRRIEELYKQGRDVFRASSKNTDV